jgi:hypothetical protein
MRGLIFCLLAIIACLFLTQPASAGCPSCHGNSCSLDQGVTLDVPVYVEVASAKAAATATATTETAALGRGKIIAKIKAFFARLRPHGR